MNQKHWRGHAGILPQKVLQTELIGVILTISGSFLIGELLQREIMAQNQSGYAVMVLLFITSFTISYLAGQKMPQYRWAVPCAAAFLYWTILMGITALFYGGQYEAVLETVTVITVGCILSICFRFLKIERRKGRRKHVY